VYELRVRNATGVALDLVRVHLPTTPAQVLEFDDLPDGASSGWQTAPALRRVAHIETDGPSGPMTLRPYDYVGEEPLPPGRYTYELGINAGRLTLKMDPG